MRTLAVVGGGPAGLATSIFAAQSGLHVTVLERGGLPRDKACGEGLMPHGARLLSEMGIEVSRSYPFEGIRYVDREHTVEAPFSNGHGIGIRRLELSRALLDRAVSLGVEVETHCAVEAVGSEAECVRVSTNRGELRARWLAAADGLASPIRRSLGLDGAVAPRSRERYGFRRHFRIRPWSRFVEVHWAKGSEAYVTPVASDEVGVALLWREKAPSFEAMLSRFPELEARLNGAAVTSTLAGAGPLRRRARRVTTGRVALVGDAAGYLDAITGEGIALGFRSARALVRVLSEGSGLDRYEGIHRAMMRRHRSMTELVLLLTVFPRLRPRILGLLQRFPALFAYGLSLHERSAGIE